LAAVRCDCGGRLQWGTETTERGLRWTFTCEKCGSRWKHRDGAAEELALLACFRRLPDALRSEVLCQVKALADGDVS